MTSTIVRTWPARYKAHQVQICEDRFHQSWIAVTECRKVLPTLRPDIQLKHGHASGLLTLDQSGRLFFDERALTRELKHMGSRDVFVFLAWLDKTIRRQTGARVGPAASLRTGAPPVARHVPMTPCALSRQLPRLRMLGLIKKVAHAYRYDLTRLGRSAIAAACSITRFNIVPAMAGTI